MAAEEASDLLGTSPWHGRRVFSTFHHFVSATLGDETSITCLILILHHFILSHLADLLFLESGSSLGPCMTLGVAKRSYVTCRCLGSSTRQDRQKRQSNFCVNTNEVRNPHSCKFPWSCFWETEVDLL
jgi:hypothetical protein